jgi:hypothetical protein
MKCRYFILVMVLFALPLTSKSQAAADELVSKCVLTAGDNTAYLKDFRVQLPKATPDLASPVYKANMYLMKNMKYRFSLCNSVEFKGELTITIYDEDKELISSFNKSTGKKYSSIDFFCNKTGLYTLWFSFDNGEQGSGVGVVSMIK